MTWPRRATWQGRDDEEGSATVEIVVLLPALLVLLFIAVQAGLMFHARQVVMAAANEGAVAASVERGTAAEGHEIAEGFLAQTADVALSSWTVTATRDADQAVVVVTGRPYTVVPFIAPTVTGRAALPAEIVQGTP